MTRTEKHSVECSSNGAIVSLAMEIVHANLRTPATPWRMKHACLKRPRWFGAETSFKQQEQLIKTAGETAGEI